MSSGQNVKSNHSIWYLIVLLTVVVFGICYFLWPSTKTATPTDRLLSGLNPDNPKLAAEHLDNSNWVFWCTGSDPGAMSGGTEFLDAYNFAKASNLAYLGPRTKTSETYDYNLLFVRADGSYLEKKVTQFAFEWVSENEFCWPRSNSFIVFKSKGLLRVEKKNG